MSVLGDFYRLEQGELKPLIESGAEVKLKVADSFLVEDGKVRSLDKHLERFASWVKEVDQSEWELLSGFFAEVKRLLPKSGRYFPRMEYHGEAPVGHRLFLRIREAPQKMDSLVLWTYPEADPRISPEVKGPDLSLCQQLRRHANMNSADEAVILNREGFVAEGALSALVWFRGDVLCSSDLSTRWLPSITRMEIFQIAESMGLQTRSEKVTPSDISKLPIWALSSLNGIMPARSWIGVNEEIPSSSHLEAFSKRLRLLSTQLD
ncbi:MAG: aminotransferase class IV [Actinomycetota bacterium]